MTNDLDLDDATAFLREAAFAVFVEQGYSKEDAEKLANEFMASDGQHKPPNFED